MARNRKYKYYSCDFETTVFEGQEYTEVWASACVELYTEDVLIFHSIDETFSYFKNLKQNCVLYYHNLKFDGSFWLDFLITKLKMKQACVRFNEDNTEFVDKKYMQNNTFQYVISNSGQWYNILIKVNDYFIEIRDSLKLLPFALKTIGKSFQTKHQKLEMEYTGFRYAGCNITDNERKYIENDVLVLKEALEIMFNEGHNKTTIGSCCLAEYKSIIGKETYYKLYPNLTVLYPPKEHNAKTIDEYVRRSYKGGWCYLVKGKENKIYEKGITADVNSLYPSMMSTESGNIYPIGLPTFWYGNFIPDEALEDNRYYFIRIKTRFYIKDNYLPFIQIKNSMLYKSTECLESSDVKIINENGEDEYSPFYIDFDGNIKDTRVELTLTCTDYILFREHYNVIDFEIIDGCWFYAQSGLFDDYMEKYKKIKMESKGAKRTLAKLFLNNLYGKMATNIDSSFKVAYEKEDGVIGFYGVRAFDKKAGYIPVGSAITSYARNFTIRTAQKNFYGKDKRGFIYADTDSIHCDLDASELKGLKVHPTDFCCWALEATWDKAIFVRQKTYIEHVIEEDLKPVDKPFNNIKCAGMPDKCKKLFEMSMSVDKDYTGLSQEEIDFVKTNRDYTDFKVGLKVPSKLLPKRVKGGILLKNSSYEMR